MENRVGSQHIGSHFGYLLYCRSLQHQEKKVNRGVKGEVGWCNGKMGEMLIERIVCSLQFREK
jgi:hypothetical protein